MNQNPQPSGTQATSNIPTPAYVAEARACLARPDRPKTLDEVAAFLVHASGGGFVVALPSASFFAAFKALSPEAQRYLVDDTTHFFVIENKLAQSAAERVAQQKEAALRGELDDVRALLLDAEDEAACSTMSPAQRATQRALAVAMASTDDLAAQQRLALFNALTLSEPHLKIALREAKGTIGAFGQGVALGAQVAMSGAKPLDVITSFAPFLASIAPAETWTAIGSLFNGVAKPPQGAPSAEGSVGCCGACASPESVAASARPPAAAESPVATPRAPDAEAPLSVAQAAGGETVAFPADAPLEDTAPPQAT